MLWLQARKISEIFEDNIQYCPPAQIAHHIGDNLPPLLLGALHSIQTQLVKTLKNRQFPLCQNLSFSYCNKNSRSVPGGVKKVFHLPNSSKESGGGSRELPELLLCGQSKKIRKKKRTWKNKTKTTHWYQAWRISSPSSVTATRSVSYELDKNEDLDQNWNNVSYELDKKVKITIRIL